MVHGEGSVVRSAIAFWAFCDGDNRAHRHFKFPALSWDSKVHVIQASSSWLHVKDQLSHLGVRTTSLPNVSPWTMFKAPAQQAHHADVLGLVALRTPKPLALTSMLSATCTTPISKAPPFSSEHGGRVRMHRAERVICFRTRAREQQQPS